MVRVRIETLHQALFHKPSLSLEDLIRLNVKAAALISELRLLTTEYWTLTVEPESRSLRRVERHLKFLAQLYRQEMKAIDPTDLMSSPSDSISGPLGSESSRFEFQQIIYWDQSHRNLARSLLADGLISALESSIEFWISEQSSPEFFSRSRRLSRARAYTIVSGHLASKRFDQHFYSRMSGDLKGFWHSECERALTPLDP